jgi:hypothetical protein
LLCTPQKLLNGAKDESIADATGKTHERNIRSSLIMETAMSTPNSAFTFSRFPPLGRATAGPVAAAILLGAVAAGPTPARADAQVCGARNDILAELTKRYSEAPVAVGLSNSGVLVEVLSSDKGATWTIIVSQPDGTSCLVAAGKEWQDVPHTLSHDVGT